MSCAPRKSSTFALQSRLRDELVKDCDRDLSFLFAQDPPLFADVPSLPELSTKSDSDSESSDSDDDVDPYQFHAGYLVTPEDLHSYVASFSVCARLLILFAASMMSHTCPPSIFASSPCSHSTTRRPISVMIRPPSPTIHPPSLTIHPPSPMIHPLSPELSRPTSSSLPKTSPTRTSAQTWMPKETPTTTPPKKKKTIPPNSLPRNVAHPPTRSSLP